MQIFTFRQICIYERYLALTFNGMKTQKRKVGDFGEKVAEKFLEKHGFKIAARNYLKKWGEIDLVAELGGVLHFVEVKTAVRDLAVSPPSNLEAKLPSGVDEYEAEENVHPWKLERLSRTIQTYLLEKKVPDEKEFQCDVITVTLDPEFKKARVKYIPDIEL